MALAGIAVLLVVAVGVVLGSLDRPWLKQRIQGVALASGGVELDYRSASVGLFEGLSLDGIVIRSPVEFRSFAPDLVRIGHLQAWWSLRSLLGQGPKIQRLVVSDLALCVVMDDNGRTSFDALFPSDPNAPKAPSTPLSRQASDNLGKPLPLGEASVGPMSIGLIRTAGGHMTERDDLRGLGLTLLSTSAEPAARGGRVQLALGTPAAPLDLHLERQRDEAAAGDGRAKLWLTVDATSLAANAALDLRVPEQTFGPLVAGDHWLHAEAHLAFDPKAGVTRITVDHTAAGDGAATVDANVELPDTGDPVVRHAAGEIDAARLLGWLPAGLVPVTLEKARVRYQIDSLVAGSVVHLSETGSASVEGELSKVAVTTPGGPVALASGSLSVHAKPTADGGVAGEAAIKLAGVHVVSGAETMAADDVSLDARGAQSKAGVIDGHASLRVGHLAREGAAPALVRDGHVELEVAALHVDSGDPLATQGDVSFAADLAGVEARVAPFRMALDGVGLRFHTKLEGHVPYSADLDLPIRHVHVARDSGAVLVDAPLHFELKARDVFPNLADPAQSRGVAHVALDLADLKTALDVTKQADAATFTLHTTAPTLHDARPFLSGDLAARIPWDAMGLTLQTSGHVEDLRGGNPRLEQTTDLQLDRAAYGDVTARQVILKLHSKGTPLQHDAELDVAAQALDVPGGAPSDDHVKLTASVDRQKPSFRIQVSTEGRMKAQLTASASFDPAHHALPYAIDLHLGNLAPLAPFVARVHGLNEIDVSQLDFTFASHGEVRGVLQSVRGDGSFTLAPQPTRTAGVEGVAGFRATHFAWTHGDQGLTSPAIAWHGELHSAGERRSVDSHLQVDAMHADFGSRETDIGGVRDDTTVTVTGDLSDPDSAIHQRLAVRTVAEDAVPEYPIGNVTFEVSAERQPDGLIHLSDLKLSNVAGGTTLDLSGNVELGQGRRTLSVTTSLTQDLGALVKTPGIFQGKGKVAVEASVTSPDFSILRVRAAMKANDVSFKMPRAGVEMETVNGEIPITVALEAGPDGVTLHPDENRSHYSMLRFADQHPLLSRNGFLSIARIKSPFVEIAPLVGNLEIEQNVVSLRQFEMGVRHGSITGQCGIDWDGPRSTLELHVRATGVQSSHGEPFDGNIAIVLSAGDRTVEGRAEILRIGERHLLDLLDMQDPLHVDPAMNRIRTALTIGYPDRLRLVFDHGFASARLELGGLARLISIGELRGIPMGPIVDKFLAPILDPKDAQ